MPTYAQSISFTPTASGTYEIDVDMSNSLISASVKYASNAKVTVKLEVAPAAPDATRSVITGEGLTLGQVDVLGSFSVLTYDKYGNAVVTERDGAVVRAMFTSSVDVADNWEASIVWSAASKRYNAAYLRTVPGIFYAEITLDANDGSGALPLKMASTYDSTVIKAWTGVPHLCLVG